MARPRHSRDREKADPQSSELTLALFVLILSHSISRLLEENSLFEYCVRLSRFCCMQHTSGLSCVSRF